MGTNSKSQKATVVLLFAVSVAIFATAANATELTGFALMSANTFAEDPTSGQFAGAGAGVTRSRLSTSSRFKVFRLSCKALPPIPSM